MRGDQRQGDWCTEWNATGVFQVPKRGVDEPRLMVDRRQGNNPQKPKETPRDIRLSPQGQRELERKIANIGPQQGRVCHKKVLETASRE